MQLKEVAELRLLHCSKECVSHTSTTSKWRPELSKATFVP